LRAFLSRPRRNSAVVRRPRGRCPRRRRPASDDGRAGRRTTSRVIGSAIERTRSGRMALSIRNHRRDEVRPRGTGARWSEAAVSVASWATAGSMPRRRTRRSRSLLPDADHRDVVVSREGCVGIVDREGDIDRSMERVRGGVIEVDLLRPDGDARSQRPSGGRSARAGWRRCFPCPTSVSISARPTLRTNGAPTVRSSAARCCETAAGVYPRHSAAASASPARRAPAGWRAG
jgi:hypothetical protein